MLTDVQHTIELARLVRYFILTSTTAAGSGHPSSSLSATDLLTALMFGGFFRTDLKKPAAVYNDRLIFSKGHAAPLFYALYAAAGVVSEKELMTLRQFGSRLEGHPTLAFPYTEAATGSLGQGLSVGVGMALNARLDGLDYRTYVLLGDSEMAEGSVWEALSCASHYKLTNLVAILDVNRLGQRGETMYGHHLEVYQARIEAFGWETIVIDGHNMSEIDAALQRVATAHKPTMIIARTIKGKGVSFIEDQEGWHGRALKTDELTKALAELGPVDRGLRGSVALPTPIKVGRPSSKTSTLQPYTAQEKISTRKAYGNALVKWFAELPDMVVLDAETSNSTYAETFKKAYPERFFEMYIAEQNMVGVALGLARRGKIPFVSTFAAFFSRAADQVRMAQYSAGNIKLVGSHAGVSIGEDGASQMGLEDLAFFRAIHQSVVLYPSDAVSTEALVGCAAKHQGLVYIRTTRKDTPILYKPSEKFVIGGSKTVRSSSKDAVTVVGAGVTLHEALAAYETLKKQGIVIRVLDLYSIKPLDLKTIRKALTETKALVVVEDHYPEGGIGEAIRSAFVEHKKPIISLAVTKLPKSGKPDELLAYEGIDAKSIVKTIKRVISQN
jgi:transketolase